MLSKSEVTELCVKILTDQFHTNLNNNDDYNNNDSDDNGSYFSDTDGIDDFAINFTEESSEEMMKHKYVYYLSLPHQK